MTRASASRAIATNTPLLVTFLTYPSTEEPGCKDVKMSSVLETETNERSISPPSSLTPRTVVLTTRPGLNSNQGFSVKPRRPSRPRRSHACARPRRVPVSCAKTLPPSFADPTFTMIAGIVSPFFTWRSSSVRNVQVKRRRAASQVSTVSAPHGSPAANRVGSGAASAAASDAVSIRGTRTFTPGATLTVSVSIETAVTTPCGIASPCSRVESNAAPATPAPPPSPAPASAADAKSAFASAGARLALSSSMDPRSPAGPSTTTRIVSPRLTEPNTGPRRFFSRDPSFASCFSFAAKEKEKHSASVACRRPRPPPGRSRMSCASCTSRTEASKEAPTACVPRTPSASPSAPPTPTPENVESPSDAESAQSSTRAKPGDPKTFASSSFSSSSFSSTPTTRAANVSPTRIPPNGAVGSPVSPRRASSTPGPNPALNARVAQNAMVPPNSGRDATTYSGFTSSITAATSAPSAGPSSVFFFFFFFFATDASNPLRAPTSTTPSRRSTSSTTTSSASPSLTGFGFFEPSFVGICALANRHTASSSSAASAKTPYGLVADATTESFDPGANVPRTASRRIATPSSPDEGRFSANAASVSASAKMERTSAASGSRSAASRRAAAAAEASFLPVFFLPASVFSRPPAPAPARVSERRGGLAVASTAVIRATTVWPSANRSEGSIAVFEKQVWNPLGGHKPVSLPRNRTNTPPPATLAT